LGARELRTRSNSGLGGAAPRHDAGPKRPACNSTLLPPRDRGFQHARNRLSEPVVMQGTPSPVSDWMRRWPGRRGFCGGHPVVERRTKGRDPPSDCTLRSCAWRCLSCPVSWRVWLHHAKSGIAPCGGLRVWHVGHLGVSQGSDGGGGECRAPGFLMTAGLIVNDHPERRGAREATGEDARYVCSSCVQYPEIHSSGAHTVTEYSQSALALRHPICALVPPTIWRARIDCCTWCDCQCCCMPLSSTLRASP